MSGWKVKCELQTRKKSQSQRVGTGAESMQGRFQWLGSQSMLWNLVSGVHVER